MTHDELLIKIIKWYDYANGSIAQVHGEFCISSDGCKCYEYDSLTDGIHKALRAVVELHKPEPLDERGDVCLTCCPDLLTLYPCSTIQQIIENLK